MTPDEPLYSGDLTDPQKLNGYIYVGNNPIFNIDPDGHDYRICVDDGTCVDMTDEQYQQLYHQQNGRQGINMPGFPGGVITCGGIACGSATYSEPGLSDDTGLILTIATSVDGARGGLAAVRSGLGLGRSIIEGIAALFGKVGTEEEAATVEDILATATKEPRSSATEYTKDGGLVQATKDFNALTGC